jgi:hypothetical protein
LIAAEDLWSTTPTFNSEVSKDLDIEECQFGTSVETPNEGVSDLAH